MKVFISADIEGVTTSTVNTDCHPTSPTYAQHARQMTDEVMAACAGAFRAGAKEIYIKDAHGPATNIDPARMPAGVKLMRGWSGHPYSMVEGVDGSFDAALFIGYHSPAGKGGNPIAHTISDKPASMTINGQVASEFFLYSHACALEGVPAVLLCGDKALCDHSAHLHPGLLTVPVKEGVGNMTVNYSPVETLKAIEEGAAKALSQDLKAALTPMPEFFEAELRFMRQGFAKRASFFPGVEQVDDVTVRFSSEQYFEILRTIYWVLH